jgi:hypothetical protein
MTADTNTKSENMLNNVTLTRRQVAVGAAWAAPVVALAVATPLAAASGTPTTPVAAPGSYMALSTSVVAESGSPRVINVNRDGEDFARLTAIGTPTPAQGTYNSGPLTLTITWGASAVVPTPGDYSMPAPTSLNGWVLDSATTFPVTGSTGSVRYVHAPILNGLSNITLLPQFALTQQGANGATTVTAILAASALSFSTNSGTDFTN